MLASLAAGRRKGLFCSLFNERNLQSWRGHWWRSRGSALACDTYTQQPDSDLAQPLPLSCLHLPFPQREAWKVDLNPVIVVSPPSLQVFEMTRPQVKRIKGRADAVTGFQRDLLGTKYSIADFCIFVS